jgi:hypothetical protein
MVIFELPDSAGECLRASALGSCRVRNPITTLRDRGDLKIFAEGPMPTHTVAEALQTLAIVLGECEIPDTLSPYIFETQRTPAMHRLNQTLRDGVDVFVLEVSDDKLFSFGDIHFNQNFVSRNLIQPQRGALLDWYRQICRGATADESCVQAALAKMREGGLPHDGAMVDLLRGVRLARQDGEQISQCLAALISKAGGRWIVIGAVAVPGHEGAIMRDRRALNAKLKDAAGHCGATFFDPSQLIADHGQANVLAAQGADIYEFADDFFPTLGEILMDMVRAAAPPMGRRYSPPRAPAKPPVRRSPPRSRLHAAWRRVTRYFGRRLERLRRAGES